MKMDGIELNESASSNQDFNQLETSTGLNSLNSNSIISNNKKTIKREINNDFDGLSGTEHSITIEKDENICPENYLFNRIDKTSYYQRIGNMHAFWFDKEGIPKIVIGPHWPFYICLTSALGGLTYVIIFVALQNAGIIMKSIGWIIYLLQFLSYTYTFLINPGLPDKTFAINYETPIRQTKSICEKCGIRVPQGYKICHCDDCGVCVVGYDHHCPWTSKCIGQGNLSGFHAFVAFTMLLFGYMIFAVSATNAK